jgi:hypothetical protein
MLVAAGADSESNSKCKRELEREERRFGSDFRAELQIVYVFEALKRFVISC